jgi:predicted oxidoreductase
MPTRRLFLQQTAAVGTFASVGGVSSLRAATEASAPAGKSALKTYKIPQTDLTVSRLGYGAAGLASWDKNPVSAADVTKTARLVHLAYENGINLFDHADLYAFGKAETVFGEVLKQSPGLRDRIVIQSKCGQRFSDAGAGGPVRVDLSREHIVSAVEGSLKRLGTDRLDILLLHAVDALVEPQEVAQAFDHLHRSGKVRYFGVSNYHAAQIALLKQSVQQPLVVNQIQISLSNPAPLAEGMEFTLQIAKAGGPSGDVNVPAGPGTIDYCRLNNIQVQAWSPLRGVVKPPADASPQLKATVQLIAELAKKKNTTPPVIALAWLLRHPAGIVPIVGGDNPEHLIENCAADRLVLSREEWYDLFAASAG